ncbi:MAG: hypothetical protein ACYCVD_12930 [Desulfitobacteriaceae bacterium]
MLDISSTETVCPKCNGLGRIENPAWSRFWTTHYDFRAFDVDEQLTITGKMLPEQPTEPMFYICRECRGRGKILTAEGEKLIKFIRFWINPNY